MRHETMKFDRGSGLYLPQNSGYGEAGASYRRRALKGFTARSGSPREDIDYNNYPLRTRSRMLYMAAPVAGSGVKTSRTNAVGPGLSLSPAPDREFLGLSPKDARAWEAGVKREFSLWAGHADACDALGLNDFYELQQLAYLSWLMSGDVFALRKDYGPERMRPYGLRLQLVEADLVATPTTGYYTGPYTEGRAENGNRIHDGVEVDRRGRVEAYHFRSTYPYEPTMDPTEWARVEARGRETGLPNVIHVMNGERPGQYRGVPYLAQVIEPLLQLRRYTEGEIDAAVVQSFITGFVQTKADASEMPFNETAPSGPDGEAPARYDPREYRFGPAQVNVMNEGESMQFLEPTHPNSTFDTFMHAMCLQVGGALEIPAEMILKEFKASYSASRAAQLEAWKAFRMFRQWFVSDFCKPVYEIWLTEAVARGRVRAPGFFTDPAAHEAWLKADWIGPSQGMLDPTKEIQAEAMSVEHGFSTHEQSTMRLNAGSWEENMEKLKTEQQILRDVMPQGGKEAGSEESQRDGSDAEDDSDTEDGEGKAYGVPGRMA